MNKIDDINNNMAFSIDHKDHESGKELPKEFENMNYVKKIQSAMKAWADCNDKRGFVLLTLAECENGDDNSRTVSVGLGADTNKLANILNSVMRENKDFRRALDIALRSIMDDYKDGKISLDD